LQRALGFQKAWIIEILMRYKPDLGNHAPLFSKLYPLLLIKKL
jgi:hypothetical protein